MIQVTKLEIERKMWDLLFWQKVGECESIMRSFWHPQVYTGQCLFKFVSYLITKLVSQTIFDIVSNLDWLGVTLKNSLSAPKGKDSGGTFWGNFHLHSFSFSGQAPSGTPRDPHLVPNRCTRTHRHSSVWSKTIFPFHSERFAAPSQANGCDLLFKMFNG